MMFCSNQEHKMVYVLFSELAEQFQVCNKNKTRESMNNILPYFDLNNEIIGISHRNQPVQQNGLALEFPIPHEIVFLEEWGK